MTLICLYHAIETPIYIYITASNVELDCGSPTEESLTQMQSCGYYVEGISLAVLGSFAILTNIFSIYIFIW